jgi:hypothetical protein
MLAARFLDEWLRIAVLVKVRGGTKVCETSCLPRFLENRFIEGGEFVSRMCLPNFIPQEYSRYSSLSAELGLGVYSASNRNEYQKHKNNNVSGE